MQCSWKAQGWAEPVTDHIDHPSLLLPRQSSVCSHSAVEHSAFWLSGGYLQGNVLSLVLGRRLSQCRQAAVVISRSSGWRILKGAQFLFLTSVAPSLLLARKARFFSKDVSWQSPGKRWSFKELQHYELSLKRVFILLFSEIHFIPYW